MLGLNGKRRMVMLMSLLLLCLAVAAGCASTPELSRGKSSTYGNDGYMGMSNSNPNLPLNPHYYNFKSDTAFMEEKLRELKGVESVRFIVTDPDIYVHLRAADHLSDEERSRLGNDAQTLLQYNMPRYAIHVDLD